MVAVDFEALIYFNLPGLYTAVSALFWPQKERNGEGFLFHYFSFSFIHCKEIERVFNFFYFLHVSSAL